MKTQMNEAQKVGIVVDALKQGDKLVKSQFAKEKGIDPRTLGRYINNYESQARKVMNQGTRVQGPTRRGGKPRNNRVSLIRNVISNKGMETPVKEIYNEVVEESVQRGMNEVTKGSLMSLIYQVRTKMS